MKEHFPVLTPKTGIYLSCVDPDDCRDTLYVEGLQKPRPVIYGAQSTPPGFVHHDKTECPVPRQGTFQTLEEFYNQDFLRTFTDCIKHSDFSSRGSKAMGFSNTLFFEGSEVVNGQRVRASLTGSSSQYSYECCVQPSFYVANVRGHVKSTAYYNPLFTTVHDFNCFAQDGCIAGGSLKNVSTVSALEASPPYDFPKSSPRSVLWYMQNSIESVHLDHIGTSITFWENGVVGRNNAMGGRLELGDRLGSSGVNQHAESLTGNAALFSSIRKAYGATDTPAQLAQVTFGVFSCPLTDGSSAIPNETWNTSLMYPIPNSWANTVSPEELECCTRGTEGTQDVEGGQAIIPQTLLSFLTNAQNQTQGMTFTPIPSPPATCSNYHCFESPYCQSLLRRACNDFSTSSLNQAPNFNYGGYCTRWRNWASNNYAPLDPTGQGRTTSRYPMNSSVIAPPANFPVTAIAYPSGAHSSSVDQSVFTLLEACSSTNFAQSQSQDILDQCNGLLSATSTQTNFPRLRPITFDTPIVYSHEEVTPYTVDASNNQVDILLTYTRYVNITDENKINSFIGGTLQFSIPAPFLLIPQIENVVSLSTIYLDNIVALTSLSFYEKVRANFNSKLAAFNGNFFSFTQNFSPTQAIFPITRPNQGPYQPWPGQTPGLTTLTSIYRDHSKNSITWNEFNSFSVATLFSNSSASPTDYSNISLLQYPLNRRWASMLNQWGVPDVRITGEGYPRYAHYNAQCNFQDCWNLAGSNLQNRVVDQSLTLVDVTNPTNLSRVDDRITIIFNEYLSLFLGLDRQGNSVTINLNPFVSNLYSSVTGIPVTPQNTSATFSSVGQAQSPTTPITIFNLINTSQFWLTNTTPIPIYSLSTLNYSGLNLYSVSFTPPSNPATPLLPGASVSVVITDPSDPDNSGSFSATPILFYDASTQGWQNNFNSPDFPVLGGFLSSRGIDISSVVNSYGKGERFGSYSADDTLSVGQGTISTILTYYKNQNVYSTGQANTGGAAAISQMFLAPLI